MAPYILPLIRLFFQRLSKMKTVPYQPIAI